MPSDRRRESSYPLRNKHAATNRGRVISALNFCRNYAIRVSETHAFTSPEVNHNGIFVLNLNEVRSVKKT